MRELTGTALLLHWRQRIVLVLPSLLNKVPAGSVPAGFFAVVRFGKSRTLFKEMRQRFYFFNLSFLFHSFTGRFCFFKLFCVKKFFLFLLSSYCCFSLAAQKFSLTIENGKVARTFACAKDSLGFYTTSFFNKKTEQEYVNPGTEEFSLTINDSTIEGRQCRYLRHSLQQVGDTQTLAVRLVTPLPDVYIDAIYQVYASLPVVRKRVVVINESKTSLAITNLDVEKLRFQVVNKFDNEVYTAYGSNLHRLPYKGDHNDAAILLYNAVAKQGAVLGNEAPSVLKNTEIYTRIHGCVQMGMRHIDETFPFKKWLTPGETFASPRTFILFFESDKWQYGYENAYKDFVRNYLGISLFQRKAPPLFFYDTWRPYLDSINENIINGSVEKLSESGADLFIIDAGWYKYSGDFIVDSSKFPHGLKRVCDSIRSRGMKIGLWFPAASVNAKSGVALQHPDWLVKDKAGSAANLHDMSVPVDGTGWSSAMKTASLGSPYYDHLKELVRNSIRELGLSYVKFDLALAVSAYVHEPDRTGDYEATGSKIYRDRASSYWAIYSRMLQLMDELHNEFPDLLIDCTFESWGRYNTVDFALLESADYDWLTNFEQPSPAGPISIRQMAYDRGRVVPPATLLIGNQSLNSPAYPYVYFSLAASSLVMVGDARKLSLAQRSFYRKWNDYFKTMEAKYHYSRYYQLYDVFDRPTDSNWDGCFRINTEKMSGLAFFFRNNSSDAARSFRIPFLPAKDRYKISDPAKKKVLGIYRGQELIEKGLKIAIPTIYTAAVLAIEKL